MSLLMIVEENKRGSRLSRAGRARWPPGTCRSFSRHSPSCLRACYTGYEVFKSCLNLVGSLTGSSRKSGPPRRGARTAFLPALLSLLECVTRSVAQRSWLRVSVRKVSGAPFRRASSARVAVSSCSLRQPRLTDCCRASSADTSTLHGEPGRVQTCQLSLPEPHSCSPSAHSPDWHPPSLALPEPGRAAQSSACDSSTLDARASLSHATRLAPRPRLSITQTTLDRARHSAQSALGMSYALPKVSATEAARREMQNAVASTSSAPTPPTGAFAVASGGPGSEARRAGAAKAGTRRKSKGKGRMMMRTLHLGDSATGS